MYSVVEIAKFVITFCTGIGKPVSNLHLQKILYYLQVHFAKKDQKLYNEDIYAWQYGPVVPEIYFLFAGYGASKIENKYETNISEEVKKEIEEIVTDLIKVSPWELVRRTHTPGNPWAKTYNNGCGLNDVIDFELLSSDCTGV